MIDVTYCDSTDGIDRLATGLNRDGDLDQDTTMKEEKFHG